MRTIDLRTEAGKLLVFEMVLAEMADEGYSVEDLTAFMNTDARGDDAPPWDHGEILEMVDRGKILRFAESTGVVQIIGQEPL